MVVIWKAIEISFQWEGNLRKVASTLWLMSLLNHRNFLYNPNVHYALHQQSLTNNLNIHGHDHVRSDS